MKDLWVTVWNVGLANGITAWYPSLQPLTTLNVSPHPSVPPPLSLFSHYYTAGMASPACLPKIAELFQTYYINHVPGAVFISTHLLI